MPMSTLQESPNQHVPSSYSDITIQRAISGALTWMVYQEERIRSQPNEELGLTEQHMRNAFGKSKAEFLGSSISSWNEMIADGAETGNQAIFNALLPGIERPVGIIRAFMQNNERWLSHIYVLQGFQQMGIGRKLVETAMAWPEEGGPSKLLMAAYNE